MTQSRLSCPKCGSPISPGSRFCEECGAALNSLPQQAPPGPPPPEPPLAARRSGSRPYLIGGLACAGVALLLACLAVAGGVIYYRTRGGPVSPTTVVALPMVQGNAEQTGTPTDEIQAPTVIPAEPTAASAMPTDTPRLTVSPRVEFSQDGISVSFDPALASSIDAQVFEAQTGDDLPPWDLAPRRTVLTFDGYPLPQDAIHLAQIFVYPVEEYSAIDPSAGDRIATLQQMLSGRATTNLPSPVPFFPSWPAGQVFVARVAYLDFHGGSGVAFLTQYGQDIYPINSQMLFYTFQGLTSDNRWLVSAVMPVANPALPDPEAVMQDPNFYDNYLAHLEEMRKLLESQPAESFAPGLDLLDALFRSIQVR